MSQRRDTGHPESAIIRALDNLSIRRAARKHVMSLITIYKPDGKSLEIPEAKEVEADSGYLMFYYQPDPKGATRKRIRTTLPYFIEDEVNA